MRNKILFLISLLVVASMVLAACAPAATPTEAPAEEPAVEEPAEEPAEEPTAEEPAEEPTEKTVLDMWSFTNELMTMAVAFECLHPDVDIQFSMVPMTDGEYQTKLLASLGTADAPDIIALEAAFVKEYVESDFLADLTDLMPLAEAANTYPSVLEVGTDNGVVKGYSFQATPGGLFYRRSLAQEYFGTDDPEEMQAIMSDLDKFVEAAAVIKEKSGGDTYIVGTSGAFWNPFLANREQPWVVDNTLTVDPMVERYVEVAKLFRDEGYESQAQQWTEGWFAGMNDTLVDAEGNPKQIFAYFLPTWGLPYVLAPNAAAADGSSDTSGDWALIPGPLPYQWGGTWIGAMKDSDNLELAKEFVEFATLNEEHLKNWATGVYTNEYLKACDPSVPDDQQQAPGDFVSSQNVVEEIIPLFDDSELSAFLGGENSYAGFAEAAPNVNARLMQGSDDAIQRAFEDARDQYLTGDITEEEMWELWKASVRNEFPDLNVP
jgi:multiple sugar transport system substrate-binding protein